MSVKKFLIHTKIFFWKHFVRFLVHRIDHFQPICWFGIYSECWPTFCLSSCIASGMWQKLGMQMFVEWFVWNFWWVLTYLSLHACQDLSWQLITQVDGLMCCEWDSSGHDHTCACCVSFDFAGTDRTVYCQHSVVQFSRQSHRYGFTVHREFLGKETTKG